MASNGKEPLIPGGYILLSRKIIESEIWDKPPLYIKVWVYLLSKAQHQDYKQLKRGQLWTSIPEIQEACSWYVGFRKETPSKDQIFRIIDWLRKSHERVDEDDTNASMITTTKATQGMLIKIRNYNVYQTSENYERNNERSNEKDMTATRPQQHRDNINKNDKNDKNDKNERIKRHMCDDKFNEFWDVYPNKKAKKVAKASWDKIQPDETLADIIIDSVIRYKRSYDWIKENGKYVPMPSTFLNQERWEDEVNEYEPPKPTTGNQFIDIYLEERSLNEQRTDSATDSHFILGLPEF